MHYNDSEYQHYRLSDVKLLHWKQHCDAYVITCTKKILSEFVAEIFKDDFNAFS